MSSPTFNLATIDVPDLTGMVVMGTKAVGSGSFADVRKGTYTQPDRTKVDVAVKILRSALLSDKHLAEKVIRKLLREARVWSTLHHPNVARFIGIYYEKIGAYRIPYLVSHFYEKTLKGNLSNVSNGQRLKFFRQLLSGLAYLHSKNVIHGDIKPKNILIDQHSRAVLTDFGLSRVLEASGFTTTSVKAPGTIRYMARELLDPKPSTTTPLATKQSDIWSAGMTGLEILSGVEPYAGVHMDSQLIYLICGKSDKPNKSLYQGVDSELWKMLIGCWAEDGERPLAQQMVKILGYALSRPNQGDTSSSRYS